MGKINVTRVILGGLLAGLIINISETVLNLVVIAEQSNANLQRLGLGEVGAHQIGVLVAETFVLGIVAVFIYAAMRPRFGAGVKTAAIAGFVVWLVATYISVADMVVGVVPPHLAAFTALWMLVELVVATIVGAWLYQESA